MKCPSCGTDNPSDARVCTFCNTPLASSSGDSINETRLHASQSFDALSPGDLIANRYEILRELGRGGMGVVYLVRDLKLQDKQMALKMISPALVSDAGARQRFVSEVVAAQEMTHANIVKVYHLDEQSGTHFFTMEYLPGQSLRAVMEARRETGKNFTLAEAFTLLTPVLSALEHAHAHGVVHRDLKPENIIINGELPDVTVKVLDFGLAKVMSPSRLTSSAVAMGTAYYMSPEQLSGKGNVDARTDLFAAGVILYELLTGEIPTGWFKMPSEINAGLPPSIDTLIKTLLSSRPEDRYPDAAALSAALQEVATQDPAGKVKSTSRSKRASRKPAPGASPPAQKFGRARRVPMFLLGIIILALLAWFPGRMVYQNIILPKLQSISSPAKANLPASPGQTKTRAVAPAPAPAPSRPAGYGTLYLTSDPDGAEILIDGKSRGNTPLTLRKLPIGTHTLEARKKYYANQSASITIRKDVVDKENLILKRGRGRITLFTEPDAADVYLDGKKAGQQTPCTLSEIVAGSHDIKLEKNAHYDKTFSVEVLPDRTAKIDETLKPWGNTRLYVRATPSNATTRILNITQRFEQGISLVPGTYKIEASAPAHETKTKSVTLAGEPEKRMTFVLAELPGRIRVTGSPNGAFAYLDGRKAGTLPCKISDIKAGTYHIRVTRTGYKDQERQITVSGGSDATVTINLEEDPTINTLGMKFVYIAPGTFMMGSPSNESGRDNDETQHRVTLTKGYYLQTTEVTQGQWRAVMGNDPSYFKNCGDNCPVESVSWNDVQEFIRKLNAREGTDKYRLPTEAEWEYACRAGSTTAYYYGGSSSGLGNYAWYSSNSGSKTHAVAQKQPNAWGLYDMHGNVWEWCADWYGDYPSGSVTDPTGPSSGEYRVYRGGSWSNVAQYCRSANRNDNTPGYWDNNLGFRLLRTR